MAYKRIISLVPSLTELLFDLGLDRQIIGRTRFCIHPEDRVNTISICGGTKNPNIEKILSLNPDLIIANKEENRKSDIEILEREVEVVLSDIGTIDEGLKFIRFIGEKLGVPDSSNAMVAKIEGLLDHERATSTINTAYFIWKDPWMTIGNDTYIHDVMAHYALRNVFEEQKRYPTTSMDELIGLSPELVLLSSEPFPFREKHIRELQSYLPNSKIMLTDGEWFSWYGSRMIPAFEGLNTWRSFL
ncbi:MAG: hypothetical protein ED557_05005 [Balneola sp.]|nr:MAG: hypothetical protein ED557_05005 [Balneola sp.]